MERVTRLLSALLGALSAWALVLLVLSLLLEGSGTSSALMEHMMLRHAPAESTGLPESDYPAMAVMITDYLAGASDTFQYTLVEDDGTEAPLFHDYEQQHMADCKQLFVLNRRIALLRVCVLGISVAFLALLHRRRWAARGFTTGTGMVILAALVLLVWGAMDFNSLFLLFHRLSFRNDLWLLNPATDLLIRLMPLGFFVHYVTVIGLLWVAALLAMFLFSIRLGWKRQPTPDEPTPTDR